MNLAPAHTTTRTEPVTLASSEFPDFENASASSLRPYFVFSAAVVLCLLPFSRKAFNVDDPLFVWTAKQVSLHPFDPYGFKLIWNTAEEPMWEITKNPPLASYFLALIAKIAGWSELALHLGFLIPAIALVTGTYRLARRFTPLAWVAGVATLASPGLLVSATSVMCDTMMVALFVWAAALWIEGSDASKWLLLVISALLIAACALTKYFGVALLLVLPLYSSLRRHRLGKHLMVLLLPIAILIGYQLYTRACYGQGLLSGAAAFSKAQRGITMAAPLMTNLLIGLSFTGGSILPALVMAPLTFRRRWIVAGGFLSLVAGVSLTRGYLSLGSSALAGYIHFTLARHWLSLAIQLALAIGGGISILALAIRQSWQERNAGSMFLLSWVLGTFVFSVFVNWTINARSLLPMIPAVGILLARQVEQIATQPRRRLKMKLALALGVSGFMALWVAKADANWADTQRHAAEIICKREQAKKTTVWFQGHWGFQYYMQALGAHPVDFDRSVLNANDLLVIPANNIETFPVKKDYIASQELLEIPYHDVVTAMRFSKASGFYSAAVGGPLPFAFGESRAERFFVFHLRSPAGPVAWDR
jgi:hypothetical protein